MSCNLKSLGDAFIIVYMLSVYSLSAGDLSEDIAGDVVGEIEDDAIFGMRLILIDDSFGIMKGGTCTEENRDLSADFSSL